MIDEHAAQLLAHLPDDELDAYLDPIAEHPVVTEISRTCGRYGAIACYVLIDDEVFCIRHLDDAGMRLSRTAPSDASGRWTALTEQLLKLSYLL